MMKLQYCMHKKQQIFPLVVCMQATFSILPGKKQAKRDVPDRGHPVILSFVGKQRRWELVALLIRRHAAFVDDVLYCSLCPEGETNM